MVDLGTLGGSSSEGLGINNAGQIAGGADTSAGVEHTAIFSNGQITDLGTLPGSPSSRASDINNLGQAVGSSDMPGANLLDPSDAFIYSNGQMTDLNDLIAPNQLTFGGVKLTLTGAEQITDDGRIIAVQNGYHFPTQTYLLTPVPEPGTLALFSAALLALGVCYYPSAPSNAKRR